MTRDETKTLIAILSASYPQWNITDPKNTVDMWAVVLSDYDYRTMQMAVKRYISTSNSPFAPSISQLTEQYRIVTNGELPTASSAWSLVRQAIGNGYYYAEREFNKLPALVQKAVGSPDVIRGWSQQNIDSLAQIEARFTKAYNAEAERERQMLTMTPSFASMIEKKQQEVKLLGKKTDC